ncbi:RICIN domain-containing protein [Bacillus thuringiensis]|uniref:RICIN domain-containing protein n=1 Tax=Bacillus thuringiensis TaxID=1428 RepID=UPI0036ECB54B
MYRFKNKGSGKYLDVARDSKAEWANIQQYEYVNGLSEKFFIHPLDNNYYAIISCLSGRALDIAYDSKDNWANVQLYHWNGGDSECWYLNPDPNNPGYHIVMSKRSGKVLDVARDSSDNWANIQMYDELAGLDGQRWLIEEDGEVTLPTITTDTLTKIPQCKAIDEVLPDKTKKVATHSTIVPAMLVTDSIYSLATQIEKSPYYILVKSQYWKITADYRLAPGESHEITNTTGMTVTDQQTIKSTIGISIQSDVGISFEGISASLSRKFS